MSEKSGLPSWCRVDFVMLCFHFHSCVDVNFTFLHCPWDRVSMLPRVAQSPHFPTSACWVLGSQVSFAVPGMDVDSRCLLCLFRIRQENDMVDSTPQWEAVLRRQKEKNQADPNNRRSRHRSRSYVGSFSTLFQIRELDRAGGERLGSAPSRGFNSAGNSLVICCFSFSHSWTSFEGLEAGAQAEQNVMGIRASKPIFFVYALFFNKCTHPSRWLEPPLFWSLAVGETPAASPNLCLQNSRKSCSKLNPTLLSSC